MKKRKLNRKGMAILFIVLVAIIATVGYGVYSENGGSNQGVAENTKASENDIIVQDLQAILDNPDYVVFDGLDSPTDNIIGVSAGPKTVKNDDDIVVSFFQTKLLNTGAEIMAYLEVRGSDKYTYGIHQVGFSTGYKDGDGVIGNGIYICATLRSKGGRWDESLLWNKFRNGDFSVDALSQIDEFSSMPIACEYRLLWPYSNDVYEPSKETKDLEDTVTYQVNNSQNMVSNTHVYPVGDSTNQELSCSTNPTITTNTKSFTHGTNYKLDGNDYCEKDCQETVTVTYGPPVATFAGGAVEYEVTVKSEVTCAPHYLNSLSMPSPPSICPINAQCANRKAGDKYEHFAGPTDDFDSCILSCDGGEYSQDCINSCYQQVYEDEQSLSNLAFNYNAPVVRQLLTDDPDYNPCASGVGYYTVNGRHIKWNYCDAYAKCKSLKYGFISKQALDDNWECASPFYLSKYGEGLKGILSGTGAKRYRFDENGFLRGAGSYGKECGETCVWNSNGNLCSSDKTYQEGCCYLTQYDADYVYKKALNTITKAKQECDSITAGEPKIDTATYTILVSNHGRGVEFTTGGSPKYSNADDITRAMKKVNVSAVEHNTGSSTMKGEVVPTSSNNNKTKTEELTFQFPKAYQNKSENEVIVYQGNGKNKETPADYSYVGNKFFTNLNTANINTKWYFAKLKGENRELAKDEIDSWNILANVNNFGLNKWNFDINCFYAVKNPDDGCPPGVPCPPPDCPPDEPCCNDTCCLGPHCSDDGGLDYIFRPIALNNIFPGEDENSSRSAGWNWSIGAINTRNGDYKINPIALKNHIENDTATYVNEELDYEIKLTPAAMRQIRADNAKRDSYLDYKGMSCSTKNDITACHSNYLDTLDVEFTRKAVIGCNNSKNGQCDLLDAVSDPLIISYYQRFGYDIVNNVRTK